MIDLHADFQERVAEVEAYVSLVATIESSVQEGVPLIRTRTGATTVVDPLQQRILYAGVYLHLYNLVEATISRCIEAVEDAASAGKTWRPGDLSAELRKEWVRSVARTNEPLNTDHRLTAAIQLCDHLVAMLPAEIKIDKTGGGNWDDQTIEGFAKRLGVTIQLNQTTRAAIKRKYRDDKGALAAVKSLRNKLAHGEMSFGECGEGRTAVELTELKSWTVTYLAEMINCFESYIQRREYLHPTKRAAANVQ